MAKKLRRKSFTKGLEADLADKFSKANDTVSDMSTVDGTAGFDTKVLSANESKVQMDKKIDITSIINELTTGGAAVPLSAEQGKALKTLVDNMSNGLAYNGVFDASGSALPSDPTQGDFYKISVAGTIGALEMAIGELIIANKDVAGSSADTDWDKIDNTEAADILRLANISTDADFTVDTTKLPDRATVKTFVDTEVAKVKILPKNQGTLWGPNRALAKKNWMF